MKIKDFQFTPRRVTVKKGGAVYWVNEDQENHTATKSSGPGEAPNSPNIGLAGGTYTDYFKETGEIRYICTYHPKMKGTVTVK